MLLSKILEELLWGMGTSIEIFLLTLLFSIPLGLAVAAGRMSSFKPLQWFMKAYISIMRGAEIFRGGIESIPNGQYEAAQVLGYNRLETFFIIILPQVIKIVLPSITNEVITLVKDTSLSFVLAIPEMFTVAKQIAAAEASISALLIAGVFYYVFNALVAFIMERFEKRLDYYDT